MTDNALAAGSGLLPDQQLDESEALHRRNMEMFRIALPEHYARLCEWKAVSKVIYTETGEPDIEFQGTQLYGGKGAFTYGEEQVEQYLAAPHKVFQSRAAGVGLDPHAQKFFDGLKTRVEEEGLLFGEFPRTNKEFYLFVFGVGLGGHIDRLIEEVDPKVLMIVEPNIDFLYHSTFFFDWERLIKKFTSNDRRMNLHVISDLKAISSVVHVAVRAINPSGLDGMLIFEHYPNSSIQQALENLLREELKVGMMGLGYFEDELHMMSNSYRNFAKGKFKIIAPYNVQTPPLPVFVCGAGPSIDNDIEFIRANQDRAVIVSCGSNIGVLLRNGIRPDFHILLERDPALLKFMEATDREFSLAGICAVGASNLYPGVFDLYDEAVLFFRPGLSPLAAFGWDVGQLVNNVDPMVANGGLAFALRMGFPDIYFFGVDCGARVPDAHHSKDAWYSTKGMNFAFKFKTPVPGNFGGTAYCDDIMSWSRTALEQLISGTSRGRRVFNCSDGALIKGTVPKLSETVTLPDFADKKAVLRRMIDGFPVYSREVFEDQWRRADYLAAVSRKVEALIKVVQDSDLNEFDYMTRSMDLLQPTRNDDAPATVVRGTIYQALAVIHMAVRRLLREEDLPRLQEIVREEYAKFLHAIEDEALDFMNRTIEGTLDLNDYMDYCMREALGLQADQPIPEL